VATFYDYNSKKPGERIIIVSPGFRQEIVTLSSNNQIVREYGTKSLDCIIFPLQSSNDPGYGSLGHTIFLRLPVLAVPGGTGG
jgi:hypothetical protein